MTTKRRTKSQRQRKKNSHGKRKRTRTRILQFGGAKRSVQVGYKDDFNLKRKIKRHEHSIFEMTSQVQDRPCYQTFSVDRNIHYLLIGLHNGRQEPVEFRLINLKRNEDQVPLEVQEMVHNVFAVYDTRSYADVYRELVQNDIRVIKQTCHHLDYRPTQLERARRVLDTINEALANACGANVSIKLDYAYELPGLVQSYLPWETFDDIDFLILCLYQDNTCLSSIELLNNDDRVDINSKTLTEYEGNRFNKLLRGVAIAVAAALGFDHMDSTAINPASAYMLLKYYKFTALTPNFVKYMTDRNVTKENVQGYQTVHNKFDVNLTLELTPENVQHALREVRKILADPDDTGILCP